MKITLVLDSLGNIVGTVHAAQVKVAGPGGAEIVAGLIPGPGQSLHEVEVPDDLAGASALDLYRGLAKLDAVQRIRGGLRPEA
jgi:hypothetical protein